MEETLPAKQVLGIVQPYSSAKEGEEGKGGQYHLDALDALLWFVVVVVVQPCG